MKQFNNVKSGQVLIFIFFFLLIIGILAGSLAFMWQSQTRTLSSEKEGLIAFYLAQAGIERAKISARYNLANPTDWFNFSGNNTTQYNFTVINSGELNRTLEGRGRRRDISSNVIAEKRITVNITGIENPFVNNPANDTEVNRSWREL